MCCKSGTETIEKSKITKLSFKELVQLKLHLAMCPPCSKYYKLSQQLDLLFQKGAKISNLTLSDQKKQEILKIVEGYRF